jgi:hypothetical protein
METTLGNIRKLTVLFMLLLVLSGLTAFPLETLTDRAIRHLPLSDKAKDWLFKIHEGLITTNRSYPFIAYGTDWLAFAHIVIAVFFIGTLKDPVKNIWVLEAGMIACILVFPLAFIAGNARAIPFWWQVIDCSFGFFGFLLLYLIYRMTKNLEKQG